MNHIELIESLLVRVALLLWLSDYQFMALIAFVHLVQRNSVFHRLAVGFAPNLHEPRRLAEYGGYGL